MSAKRTRIGTILALYSLVSAFLFFTVSFVFIKTATNKINSERTSYLQLGESERLIDAFLTGYAVIPVSDMQRSYISSDSLADFYMNQFFKYFPFLIFILVLIVATGTWALWFALKRLNEKQSLVIAMQLKNIENSNISGHIHPEILDSYKMIKERLDTYVGDYIKLCGYITHEQKNILSLLRAKLQLQDNNELVGEVDRVVSHIDDVLTLSATKGMDINETADVALICANVCDEYKKIYKNIRFDFDDMSNTTIAARDIWIYRAVFNLVGNAVKYGKNTDIQVSVENNRGCVKISVSDSGSGIDEREQNKLFENRYRLGNLKQDGYGIGLSLVSHVCDLCGGFIWLESEPGKGAEFSMIFPEA